MPEHALSGLSILVVEDDYFIASEIERVLTKVGARALGPFGRVELAREALSQGKTASAAVLDINIAGTMIYPLAEELRAAGVPFLFATGYDAHVIPAEFDSVPRLVKPIEPRRLLEALASLVAQQ